MSVIKKTIKWMIISLATLISVAVVYLTFVTMTFDPKVMPENYGKFETKLYLGSGEKTPLIVGFGGGEGGNAWATDYWKPQRDRFLEQGYSFLAVGYFGIDGIQKEMDRIPLDKLRDVILKSADNPKINQQCIALIGGSKGAELGLTLASYYDDFKAVVALVPASSVFVGLSQSLMSSSFTINEAEIPFVPVPWSALPAIINQDLRSAFDIMIKDQAAMNRAAIKVENINGPLLFLSATEDEFWPSQKMSEDMMSRLQEKNFSHPFEHIILDGNHTEPVNHFDKIESFLAQNFLSENIDNCPR